MAKKKTIPEIILRVISGTILIVIVSLLVLFNNKIYSTVLVGIITLFAVWEYFNCVNLKKSPYMIYGILLSLIITVLTLFFYEKIFSYLSLFLIFVFVTTSMIGLFFSKKYPYKTIPLAVFGYIYTIFLTLFINKIFFLDKGNYKLGLLLTIVVATDTFAFLIGRKIGKHKLTKISPNKSIEGSIAGVVFAIMFTLLYSFLVNKYLDYGLNYLIMSLVGLFLSIISQIGDLIASYIKRSYDKKDFGNILPGQGGFLDRIDSLIFAAPFAYVIILLLM